MSNGDIQQVAIPVLGTVDWAACVAGGGDLWGCSPLGEFTNMLTSLFEGVPKLLKTEEAVARLAQSHLWQFQALAANLEIWIRNGVPLSTSNPVLRAQLSGWINGTLRLSGLGLTEAQVNQADTTLWQLFSSQTALPAQALDNLVLGFQRVNAILAQTGGDGGGGTGGGGGGGPLEAPCPPFQALPACLPQPGTPDPNQECIGQGLSDIADWLEILAIYAMNTFQQGAGDGGGGGAPADPVTCTQLTELTQRFLNHLNELNATIAGIPSKLPAPPAVDLSAIDADLKAIATAIGNPNDAVAAQLKRLADSNDAADALATAAIEHWASMIPNDPAILQLVTS